MTGTPRIVWRKTDEKEQSGCRSLSGSRLFVRPGGPDVELLIRNASDGKKYLYDIVNIKENATAQIDLTQKEARSAAYRAATGDDVSAGSVHQDSVDVKENTRFSPKAGTEMQTAAALHEEERLLREQTRELAQLQKENRTLTERWDYLEGADITPKLQALYDYMASGTDGKDEPTYSGVRERAGILIHAPLTGGDPSILQNRSLCVPVLDRNSTNSFSLT